MNEHYCITKSRLVGTKILNLEKYLVEGSKVLMTFEHGSEIRKMENLLDYRGVTEILVPDIIYSVFEDFVDGLLHPLLIQSHITDVHEIINSRLVFKSKINIDKKIKNLIRIYSRGDWNE